MWTDKNYGVLSISPKIAFHDSVNSQQVVSLSLGIKNETLLLFCTEYIYIQIYINW